MAAVRRAILRRVEWTKPNERLAVSFSGVLSVGLSMDPKDPCLVNIMPNEVEVKVTIEAPVGFSCAVAGEFFIPSYKHWYVSASRKRTGISVRTSKNKEGTTLTFNGTADEGEVALFKLQPHHGSSFVRMPQLDMPMEFAAFIAEADRLFEKGTAAFGGQNTVEQEAMVQLLELVHFIESSLGGAFSLKFCSGKRRKLG